MLIKRSNSLFLNNQHNQLINILIAGLLSLFLMAFMLSLSVANWQDLEKLVARISFLSFDENDQKLQVFVEFNDSSPQVLQIINNSSFEFGLDDWDNIGNVSVGNDLIFGNFLEIGEANSSNLISENCVTQVILPKADRFNLLIDYQAHSTESLPLFDSLAYMVFIDDRLVHQEPMTQGSTQFITSVFPINLDEFKQLELKICAGNSGDRANSSWVRLFQVSTFVAPINPESLLTIKSNEDQLTVSYSLEGERYQQTVQNHLSLSFTQPLDDDLLTIETPEESYQLPIIFYSQPPIDIENPKHCFADDNQLILTFFDAEMTSSYQFGWKAEQDSQTIWSDLNLYQYPAVDVIRPSCYLGNCFYEIKSLEICSSDHQIFVKSCDSSGQCSQKEQSVQVQSCQELLLEPHTESIKINEVMFNPLGDDRGDWYEGEWVELFNPSWVDLDLDGYQIKDQAGWEINLNPNSCDNNRNIEDEGETLIPAGGFLVAFTRGRAIFNNTGDSVFLFNTLGQLIDQVTYPGSSIEDRTYARYPDGANSWYSQMFSTPLEKNRLP